VANGDPPEHVLASLRVASRDNARTPMQWDDGPQAGFTSGTPWMPVNPNHREINAQAALADPDSVLHHYRRLIALRHSEPVVAHGDFHMLLPDHPQVYAYVRRLGDSALLVLANLSGDPATIDVPDAGRWRGSEVLLTNVAGGEALSARCTLQPWEARVHRTT